MGKVNLEQTAEKLFAKTTHQMLYGVASCNEFFTSENLAVMACKKGEKPVPFERLKVQNNGKKIVDEVVSELKDKITAIRGATSLDDLEAFKEDESIIIQKELEKKRKQLTKTK